MILTISSVIISVNKRSVEVGFEYDFSKTSKVQTASSKPIKAYFEDLTTRISRLAFEDAANHAGLILNVSDYDYSRLGIVNYTFVNYSNESVLYYILDYELENNLSNNPWNVSSYPCFRHDLPDNCSKPSGKGYDPYYGEYNARYLYLDRGINDLESLYEFAISKSLLSSIDYEGFNHTYDIEHFKNITVDVIYNNVLDGDYDFSSITVKVDFNMLFTSRGGGEVFDVSEVTIKLPYKFSSMFDLANHIMVMEGKTFDFDIKNDIIQSKNRANFNITVIHDVNEKGDSIVEINDRVDLRNFTYRFAISNRPPVLDYIYYPTGEDKFYVGYGDDFTLKVSGYDPDDEDFSFDIFNITSTYSMPNSMKLLKERAIFDRNGFMNFSTDGIGGEFNLQVRAFDGVDYDYQDIVLVINDIPQVNFTMENGYYWYPGMEIKDGTYNLISDPNFIPPMSDGPCTADNDNCKLIYAPCDGYDNVMPQDEFVKFNASVIDFYAKDGLYFYDWTYTCEDDPMHYDISSCNVGNGRLYCFVDVRSEINCDGDVKIHLNVSDGLNSGSYDVTYAVDQCLACRPCCVDATRLNSNQLCDFSVEKSHGIMDNMPYYITKIPNTNNRYYYGKLADINSIEGVNNLFSPSSVLNVLRYDDSRPSGIVESASATDEYYDTFDVNLFNFKDGEYYYKYNSDFEDFTIHSACLMDSSSIGNIYSYELDNYYYKGYFYYQPMCNGVNSFCDPINLDFGDDIKHKASPSISKYGSQIAYKIDSYKCSFENIKT